MCILVHAYMYVYLRAYDGTQRTVNQCRKYVEDRWCEGQTGKHENEDRESVGEVVSF